MFRWPAWVYVLFVVLIAASGLPPKTSAQAQGLSGVPIANPYCNIPTYLQNRVLGEARAALMPNGRPVIFIETDALIDEARSQFLLAHECCHHTRGHLVRLKRLREERGQSNVLGMVQRSIELDADCCAAIKLKAKKHLAAITHASRSMKAFGTGPTGPRYPAGVMRARVIHQCARTTQEP